MYKHWKKILLAMTAFFWNACDDNSATAPVFGGSDSSSSTATDGLSSSSAAQHSSSSVAQNPSSSSNVENANSSSATQSSSSEAGSSSSTPVPESSSSLEVIPQPLYGVLMGEICTKTLGDSTLVCADGLTCVESVIENAEIPSCSGDQICAKYGVLMVKEKTYKCSDGRVYNEAEFMANYNIFIKTKKEEKTPCHMNGTNAVECDNGETFSIETDEKGNKIYSNAFVQLSEKSFFEKYELLERMPVLYGPPCVFDGTCGDEEK